MDSRKILCSAGLYSILWFVAGCSCYTQNLLVERTFQPEVCNDDWDPVLGSCYQCGVCGGTDCPGFTPCMYLKHMKTCVAGCGEIYWNEWLSDPPDECDPCDGCGQWVGQRCCPPKLLDRFASGLPGQRGLGHCCGGECGGECAGDSWMPEGSIEEMSEPYEEGPIMKDVPRHSPKMKEKNVPTPAAPKEVPKVTRLLQSHRTAKFLPASTRTHKPTPR